MRRSPRLLAATIAAFAALVPLAACGAGTTATSDAVTSIHGRSTDPTDATATATATDSADAIATPTTSGDPHLPSAIECLTQYRPDAEVMTGAEEPTLRVERVDGPAGATTTQAFATMSLRVTYVGDAPDGRSVSVDVLGATKEPLVHTLYQLGTMDLGAVAFAGGHGFTGLQYVASGPALLQVSCAAVP